MYMYAHHHSKDTFAYAHAHTHMHAHTHIISYLHTFLVRIELFVEQSWLNLLICAVNCKIKALFHIITWTLIIPHLSSTVLFKCKELDNSMTIAIQDM